MPDMNFDTGHFDWTVSALTVVAGTPTTGDQRNTYLDDSSPMVITEENATNPAYDLRFVFSKVRALATHPGEQLVIDFKGFNDGSGAGHKTKLQLWNYDTEVFDDVTADLSDLDDSETDNEVLQFVVEAKPYCSATRRAGLSDFDNTVILKVYHDDAGTGAHTLEIEKLSITFATPSFA